jgi:dipeptidyl-peptidase III
LKAHLYESSPEPILSIGKRSLGHVSNYYLGEPLTDEENAAVQAKAEELDIDILNTRSASSVHSSSCILLMRRYEA